MEAPKFHMVTPKRKHSYRLKCPKAIRYEKKFFRKQKAAPNFPKVRPIEGD